MFPEEDSELAELEPEEAAEELARRLAEFRRAKEGAGFLRERLDERRNLFFRLGPAPLAPQPERKLAPQAPEKLAGALRALAVEPPAPSLAHMALRFPPVTQFIERWRSLLRRRSRFDFDQEVDGLSRVEVAVAFLALLELRKQNEIAIAQAAPFAPIRISRADAERSLSWTTHLSA
jgi:chromatin segregation and condensation protein Rec8/ScpA/Scc1 (kleisin family)